MLLNDSLLHAFKTTYRSRKWNKNVADRINWPVDTDVDSTSEPPWIQGSDLNIDRDVYRRRRWPQCAHIVLALYIQCHVDRILPDKLIKYARVNGTPNEI